MRPDVAPSPVKGEVVWTFLFDTGGEVDLGRIGDVLQLTPSFEPVPVRRAAPRNIDLPRPLSVRFPKVRRPTTLGDREFDLAARIYAIGAVAVNLRMPVDVPDWGKLRDAADLAVLDAAGEEASLETVARDLFAQIRSSIAHAIVEEYAVATAPESYVAYCVTDPSAPVENLLYKERRQLAALLANEPDPSRLGPEEIEDNLRYWFRYYEDDLVIVDWDYGLIVEPTGKYEDVLFVMELANLQLLELRTYDAFLDGVLDRAYDDLSRFYQPGGIFRSARDLQEELSNARIDLIRVTDDIHNIGKIFGDYFLAKVYVGLTQRFHLSEWEESLARKLEALEGVYTLASHEVEHRRGVLLEGTIVLLFVLDLALLVLTAL